MSGEVFAADADGWRRMNSGRPAHELIREAVQNAFDEPACTRVEVDIEYADGGVNFVITDDVPGGIRDERLIWTIWMSDKADSPQKRGRMGRGLKELISVSDWSLIVTAGGPAVEFKRCRGKWARTSPKKKRPTLGTVIEGRCKLWKATDAKDAAQYLNRVRPPKGVQFFVNGRQVEHWWKAATETYTLKLPTVIFEAVEDGERVERSPRRECTVELFPVTATAAESWIYEMGIPIEKIDFPMSVDVGQRIPLREKRDTLTDPYRRELFAKLLDARSLAGKVDADTLRDKHVILATQAPEHLSETTKQRIAAEWTNGTAYAATPEVLKQATGQHVPAVLLRKLPEGVREIVREVGTDAKKVLEDRAAAACSPIHPTNYTEEQGRLATVWAWIAAGINRACTIQLCTGRPSAIASFNRDVRVLTVYVDNMRGRMRLPLRPDALSVLIHELAHWKSQDNEHGMGFHSDAELVGAEVASFLLEHAEEARAMFAGKDEVI